MKLILSLLLLSLLVTLYAQGKSYSDGHGGRITLPAGDISFADKVVAFDRKTPYSSHNSIVEKSLGVKDRKSLSLSCGGLLTLAFVDNVLMDIEGADLHIFEVGPKIEPTALAISKDGIHWIEIGEVSGGKSEIDIAPFVQKDDTFSYVRLRDLKSSCKGSHPGADIDAVAAIGSKLKFSLSSAVLFDSGKYILKPSAHQLIHTLLEQGDYQKMKVNIEGHTDNIAGKRYNHRLSLSRAESVKRYLLANEGFDIKNITIKGYGESQPIADNSSTEGRAINRRVELLFSME